MTLTLDELGTGLFAKDKNSIYTWCNEKTAEVLGLDSPSQVVGKKDHDLIWHKHATLYLAGDAIILKGHHQNNVHEPQTRLDHPTLHEAHTMTTKSPVYDKTGNICGILGFFTDPIVSEPIRNNFELSDNGSLCLGHYYNHSTLSKRECDILMLVLKGTKPHISQQTLGITKSTYDSLIGNIKRKMGCTTTGDIIYSSIQSGLTRALL